MYPRLYVLCTLLLLWADTVHAATEFLEEGLETSVPMGHKQFCRDFP
jgi:predicted transglutaminase-like cysteine proteinase